MRMKSLSAAMVAAGVLAVGTAGALEWGQGAASPRDVSVVAARTQVPAAPIAPIALIATPDFRAIVKQAGPAVVGVTVEGMHRAGMEGPPQAGPRGMPPGMEEFFRSLPGAPRGPRGGDSDSDGDGDTDGPSVPSRGQGSGFIVSDDGLILTNAHVVRGAQEVTVKLSDRREFSAKVLGADPVTDVAVLRIEAKGLPTVRLGDPRQLEVGDPVLAIGAPFGFEQTATQGIVSAKGRSLPGDSVVPFIQTDAAVNPGNSGGPLFDASGAVVGINAQIYSRTGGFQGLSFSIPIDVALKVKDQIVATGKASHARLGVTVQDLNQALAQSFGLSRPDGALISQVAPGSAAAAAGLEAGDVVTQVNGEPVVRSGELSSRIGLAVPGDTVKLQVWRGGVARSVDAKLGSPPANRRTLAQGGEPVQGGQLGLALRALTPEEKSAAKLEQGLLIERVAGPAQRAGVESGDVLISVNGRAVQSLEQVRAVLAGKPKSVALLLQRDGNRIFVPVNLG